MNLSFFLVGKIAHLLWQILHTSVFQKVSFRKQRLKVTALFEGSHLHGTKSEGPRRNREERKSKGMKESLCLGRLMAQLCYVALGKVESFHCSSWMEERESLTSVSPLLLVGRLEVHLVCS